jgi:hypothetical protein
LAQLVVLLLSFMAAGCGGSDSSTMDRVQHQDRRVLAHQTEHRKALERKLAEAKAMEEQGERASREAAPIGSGGDTSGGGLLSPDAAASFEALVGSVPGNVGLALAPLGDAAATTFGGLQVGHAWSSIKVPILVTLMREGTLDSEEEGWATSAIEASDNDAAAALFDQLEQSHGGLSGASAAVTETLAVAGDTGTTVATAPPPAGAVSTYGQTEWSLSGSVAFYRSLANGCLLDSGSTEYVLGLMQNVIPEQRWGLGEAGFDPSWSVAMKGGWGPESGSGGYLVRQAGIVQSGSSGIAVAMMAEDSSGTYEAGAADLTQVATWLQENLKGLGPSSSGC